MDVCLKTGFESISHNIDFTPAILEKGKQLADVNVIKVMELKSKGISILTAEVIRQTSVNAPAYKIKLEVGIV